LVARRRLRFEAVNMSAMGTDLAEYLTRASAPPKPDVLRAIEQPIHPAHAMRPAELDRLLDPSPLAVETGWCWTPEHIAYVAVRTEMPSNSSHMWDWWFDWHPRDSLRYRVWCPEAHFGISFIPPAHLRTKPFWGATHFADEDVGVGRQVVRIEFRAPTEYGFSTDGSTIRRSARSSAATPARHPGMCALGS
jgi:hypothetical protein